MPCVDGLDGRLVGSGEVAEVHHLRLVEQFPPVQVAPVVGRELAEERMRRVDGRPCGVWRAHLKPARVPEHGQVGLLHVVAKAHLSGRRYQHAPPFPQCGHGPGVERVGHKYALGLGHVLLGRINPKLPAVLYTLPNIV